MILTKKSLNRGYKRMTWASKQTFDRMKLALRIIVNKPNKKVEWDRVCWCDVLWINREKERERNRELYEWETESK